MAQSINLIPQEEVHQQTQTKVIKSSSILTIFLAIVVAALSAYYFFQVTTVKSQIRQYDENIASQRIKIQALAPIEISARNLYARFEALKTIYLSRPNFSLLLEAVLRNKPDSVVINDFTVSTGGKLTITSSADNYLAISEFVQRLTEDSEIFSSITLNSVNLENRSGKVNFFLQVEYNQDALTVKE